MSWADEVKDGIREQIADGAGAVMVWRGKSIPIIHDAGLSMLILANGGEVDSENATATVLRADLASLVAGKIPKTGNVVKISGVCLKVKSVVNDPADPSIRLFLVGEEQ